MHSPALFVEAEGTAGGVPQGLPNTVYMHSQTKGQDKAKQRHEERVHQKGTIWSSGKKLVVALWQRNECYRYQINQGK